MTPRAFAVLWLVSAACARRPSMPESARSSDSGSTPLPSRSFDAVPTGRSPPSVPPSSAPLAGSGADVVVYNPGRRTGDPHVRDLVGPEKLDASAERRILGRLFGSHYLVDPAQCRDLALAPANARKAGNFVPSVQQQATGSFTKAGAHEELYAIADRECGAGHAEGFGSVTLAAFDGDRLVSQAVLAGGSSIVAVVDIEGDRRDEVVLGTGSTNQGFTVESARIVQIDVGGVVPIKGFGQIYDDDCGAGASSPAKTYAVIHALVKPGAPPEFRLVKKVEPCP